MYEKYGSEFIREHNSLWTSNEDTSVSYRSIAKLYNGCNSDYCTSGQYKDSEISVLPIREF